MKCIKNIDGIIRRVKDDIAIEHINSGGWKYITKTEWKAFKATKERPENKMNVQKKSNQKSSAGDHNA